MAQNINLNKQVFNKQSYKKTKKKSLFNKVKTFLNNKKASK